MTKAELQIDAQSYTDSSFKRTLPGTYYNAWSTMSQLITKGLIQKTGNPAKYSLTSEGRELSEKLINSDDNDLEKHSTVTVVPTQKVSSPVKERGKKLTKTPEITKKDEREIQDSIPNIFAPGSFTIHLLVDTAETNGGLRKEDDLTVKELEATGINFEVRHLKVGDFAWICRHKESKRELVLPYIVERKRLDDLSRSIRDGRFHEQKFRLKQCGLPNLIYLVEGMGKEYYGLPASSLLQAIMNTQVSDNFIVKITSGHKDSMKYLATLTTIFTNTFRTRKLTVLEKEFKSDFNIHSDTMSLLDFKEFSQDIGKTRNFSIKEMFVKQLVQLHGMSADKAWAVVQKYPTPAALIKAYREKGPQLLSDLQYGPLCRRIGPSISIILNEMYTKRKFAD